LEKIEACVLRVARSGRTVDRRLRQRRWPPHRGRYGARGRSAGPVGSGAFDSKACDGRPAADCAGIATDRADYRNAREPLCIGPGSTANAKPRLRGSESLRDSRELPA